MCYVEYFMEHMTFVANYQPVTDVLIHMVPTSMVCFRQDIFGITPLVLYSLYVPKTTEFYQCIIVLQEKCKVALLNLAHPVVQQFP